MVLILISSGLKEAVSPRLGGDEEDVVPFCCTSSSYWKEYSDDSCGEEHKGFSSSCEKQTFSLEPLFYSNVLFV